jgi:zinc protease
MSLAKQAANSVGSTSSRIQRVISKGGIEAWLIEEYAVPLIAVEFSFAGGTAQDPKNKAGLTNFLAGMFDEGAGPYDAAAFQEELDEHAINLRFSESRDELSGSLKTLTRHADKAFDMLRLALNEARFEPSAVDRVRAQILGGIKRRANDPNSLSSKAWFSKAFGKHPYAMPDEGLTEHLETIKSEDLSHLSKKLLARSNLKISVVGAIDANRLADELDRVFGALPAKADIKAIEQIMPVGLGEIEIIDLDIPQSTIRFGMPGLLRKEPDFVAATVMNHILGGGSFTSRIWQEVREKRGLAYSVSTGLYPYKNAGLFFGGTATKNDRAKEALDVIKEEIAKMATKGPTADELAKAKSYLMGSFALRFDTSTKIANQLTMMQVEDLGIDYIAKRNAMFEAVTMADTKKVAKKLLGPGQMLVTIVGRPTGF